MASIQTKNGKDGKKTFYVVLSIDSRHKWLKAGATLADAKKLKRQVESLEKSRQIEKLGLNQGKTRIDDFFQEYADYFRLHISKNSVRRYLNIINTFMVFLEMCYPQVKYLSQIKQSHIEDFQKKRLESAKLKEKADGLKAGVHKFKKLPKPQTVNHELRVLKTAFLWALNHEYIEKLPTKHVKTLKPANVRQTQILSLEQCDAFLKTAKSLADANPQLHVYYFAFKFILNTGLRASELCNLTWNDINLDNATIKIQAKDDWAPKSYSREFFLNDESLNLLKSINNKKGYVFKRGSDKKLDNDRLRKALIKIAKAAGFENFTRVHDLRHTFNSLMQMNGVDIGTMGKILGHRNFETTMIYTHQTVDHMKKSINKVGI